MDKERSAIMNGKKKAIIIIVAVIAVAFVGLVISSYFGLTRTQYGLKYRFK